MVLLLFRLSLHLAADRLGSFPLALLPSPPPVSISFPGGRYAQSMTLRTGEDELSALYYHLELKIATQPPAKTVYQRILKPFPCVVLVPKGDEAGPEQLAALARAATSHTANSNANSSNQHPAGLFFVEASLVRSDTGTPVTKCLDGNSVAQFERSSWNGGSLTATFKKLKILSTSQQLQGLLRLKFTLKRYTGTAFTTTAEIPNRSVLSHPIEIFSHSQYLHRRKKPLKQEAEIDQDSRRIGPRDKVHLTLITAIKTFKERGGTREMLAQCIDACFDEGSPSSHQRLPSSPLPSPSSLFGSWEITMDNGASRHLGPAQNACSTSTSPSTNNEISHRGTKRGHEASSAQSPQHPLPSLRQQLLVSSPQQQQAGAKISKPKREVAPQPHAVQQARLRSSLPVSTKHPRIDLVESSPTSTSSSPSSSSSQILPPLSALSLLPPPSISVASSAPYTPISPCPIPAPPSPVLPTADLVLAGLLPFLHAHTAAFSQAYHAINVQQMYLSAQQPYDTGGGAHSGVGKRKCQHLP